MFKNLRKRIKEEMTPQFIRFSIIMIIGVAGLISVIIFNNDLVFSVGFAILFYVGCNILIRNFANDENKEIYNDMSDSALFSVGIMYIIKIGVFHFFGKNIQNESTLEVITVFLLYVITLLIFAFILYRLSKNGEKNYTHWSTEEKQYDLELLNQSILMFSNQKNNK